MTGSFFIIGQTSRHFSERLKAYINHAAGDDGRSSRFGGHARGRQNCNGGKRHVLEKGVHLDPGSVAE
jgi:hypothetical protein